MVCNNYLEHLCGSIQYKHTRTVYDPGYAWPRFALIRFQFKDRFVAIRFKQTTDSYLIRFLILAASRFLGAPVDSIRFDSKRFCFFRFRTGSIPYVQRFRFLNRFGTILQQQQQQQQQQCGVVQMQLSIYLSIQVFVILLICLSDYLSVDLSIYLIYLSIYLQV